MTLLRGDLEAPDVPILVGGLSEPLRTRSEHERTVDHPLRDFTTKEARSVYVESNKLARMANNTHFDAASAPEFGRRYAKALLQVLKAPFAARSKDANDGKVKRRRPSLPSVPGRS